MMNTVLLHREQEYVVRDMLADDLETILLIEQAAQAHPWSASHFQSSLQSSHQCYVLERHQTIVAYGVTSTAADEAELLNITVALQYQQQGLGKLLLEYISGSFKEVIHTLFLEVRASNQSAIALYNGLYFNEVGLRANYYPSNNGKREDAIIMAKSLAFK